MGSVMDEQSMRSSHNLFKPKKKVMEINTSTSYPYLQGLMDIDQIINNQIIAARMAEHALKELENDTEDKVEDLQMVLDEAKTINNTFEDIKKERDELAQRV
jgi:hypothetical protein